MTGAPTNPILRFVRRIAGAPGPAADPDGQLLERFVRAADEGAFRAILGRPGTVYSRLAWARDRLRRQLGRRGLAFSVAALAACLSRSAASAAVPAPVMVVTSKAALAFAAGQAAAAGTIPATAAALAEGVLR